LELVRKLGTTQERRTILEGFLQFRSRLSEEGLVSGYQWLDGSFLENIEVSEARSPRDIDVVTVYWGYDEGFQLALVERFPEFVDAQLSKSTFKVDHYPFDAGHSPEVTVEVARYWTHLFSHNRNQIWKGMLKIDLNTPTVDAAAMTEIQTSGLPK